MSGRGGLAIGHRRPGTGDRVAGRGSRVAGGGYRITEAAAAKTNHRRLVNKKRPLEAGEFSKKLVLLMTTPWQQLKSLWVCL